MKLWLLRSVENLGQDNPWEPWYDKAFGFVVRAETEEDACKIAHENAGDEICRVFLGREISETTTPWLDAKYSTCEQLEANGSAGVVMVDFAAA